MTGLQPGDAGFLSLLVGRGTLDVSLANAKQDSSKSASEFKSHPFYWAAFYRLEMYEN